VGNDALWNSDRIKIARVITRLIVGGPTLHTLHLSKGLEERFETTLICGRENDCEDSMLDFIRSHGVTPVVMPEMVANLSIKLRDLQAITKLFRLFRKFRPHIVATHTAKAGFLGRIAAKLAGVPVIVHTYHGHILRGYYSDLISSSLCRMEQGLGLISDRLIAISPAVKKDLVQLGIAPEQKIAIVPLGLDLTAFIRSSVAKGSFRSELGISSAVPLIGIVGRIVPIKNHELFIDAANLILRSRPDARFVVVGDGPHRPAIVQYANEKQLKYHITFTSWRRDLERIYPDLDVLIVSSINEGTPVSAIEAMAAGCPVVATRVGGVPDVIEDNNTGVLVEPGNAATLANAVLNLVANPSRARALGQAARTDVTIRYRKERLIADIQALYFQLLHTKKVVSSPRTTDSIIGCS